ncbi:MAG: hypothetical protein R3B84_23210 [Zavarzinella sp.]
MRCLVFLAAWAFSGVLPTSTSGAEPIKPVRVETISPIRNATFNKNGQAKERKQGGNPREVNGMLIFEGSKDGDRQVDPQIAVGPKHILHGTNSGLVIYDKKGNFVQGVRQNAFNDGIDPKLYYDIHNKIYVFDLWVYWDKAKTKPVNISASETDDPTKGWNTYPVPAPGGVDGGGIGHSRKWVGYSFPGGPEQTFVMSSAAVKSGKPAKVYHFAGNLGHPVNTLDAIDDLYFIALRSRDIVFTRVGDAGDGTPVVKEVISKPHGFANFGYPPPSPQKGTKLTVASGDRNPKSLVVYHGSVWFSQAVNVNGRSAVQWHQFKLDGTKVQSGLIAHPTNSYIQTTLAVNKNQDVLIGFQETGPDMFVSPRCALHKATHKPGEVGEIIKLGEGRGATAGGPWGDYSGTVVDSENMLDLWTIQSIASDKGKGETVIVKIPGTGK